MPEADALIATDVQGCYVHIDVTWSAAEAVWKDKLY